MKILVMLLAVAAIVIGIHIVFGPKGFYVSLLLSILLGLAWDNIWKLLS